MSGVRCHMSCVTCYMSHVTCHMSCVEYIYIYFFGHSGEASQRRVCYQQGLPRLVFKLKHLLEIRKIPFKKTKYFFGYKSHGRLVATIQNISFFLLKMHLQITSLWCFEESTYFLFKYHPFFFFFFVLDSQ